MSRTVLRVTVLTIAYLILLGLLGVSLPFALALNGGLPLSWALIWTIIVIVAGALYDTQVHRGRNEKHGNGLPRNLERTILQGTSQKETENHGNEHEF